MNLNKSPGLLHTGNLPEFEVSASQIKSDDTYFLDGLEKSYIVQLVIQLDIIILNRSLSEYNTHNVI